MTAFSAFSVSLAAATWQPVPSKSGKVSANAFRIAEALAHTDAHTTYSIALAGKNQAVRRAAQFQVSAGLMTLERALAPAAPSGASWKLVYTMLCADLGVLVKGDGSKAACLAIVAGLGHDVAKFELMYAADGAKKAQWAKLERLQGVHTMCTERFADWANYVASLPTPAAEPVAA